MQLSYKTTSFQPTGNRYVDEITCGKSPSPRRLSKSVVPLRGRVTWLVGSDSISSQRQQQRQLLLQLGDNSQERLMVLEDGTTESEILDTHASVAASRPLVVKSILPPQQQGNLTSPPLLEPIMIPSDASPWSSPVFLSSDDGSSILYVNDQQQLAMGHFGASKIVGEILDPLIDAHITYTPTNGGMWAVLHGSTNQRYVHDVLGDEYEAYQLSVIARGNDSSETETSNLQVLQTISLEGELVFEQLGAVWVDINQDGIDDLLTTISAPNQGAAMRVYFLENAADDVLVSSTAQSPYIGRSGRWEHVLAAGPFGPLGEFEIVTIRTPHIGGIVRYYRWDGGSNLDLVARTSDCSFTDVYCSNVYTSHQIGSRNLDQAIVGDFNGDGVPELVVQNQERNRIAGLQRCSGKDDIVEVWSESISSAAFSNFGVACDSDTGVLDLAVATTSNDLVRLTFEPDASMIQTASPCTISSDAVGMYPGVAMALWLCLVPAIFHLIS